MMEKELLEKDIPWGYPLCFNDDCAKKDRCMHYQARLLMSKDRYSGNAIYPTAWMDGECKCFSEMSIFIPTLGTKYSQVGNELFPRWE